MQQVFLRRPYVLRSRERHVNTLTTGVVSLLHWLEGGASMRANV